MYAFGLAVVKLGLKLTVPEWRLQIWPDKQVSEPIIHYAYGDERWSKRDYYTKDEAVAVWNADQEAISGIDPGELLSQIRQAREFYHDPNLMLKPKST